MCPQAEHRVQSSNEMITVGCDSVLLFDNICLYNQIANDVQETSRISWNRMSIIRKNIDLFYIFSRIAPPALHKYRNSVLFKLNSCHFFCILGL